VTAPEAEPPEPSKGPVSVHRCERCHLYFRVDAGVDRGYALKRWLCPPCYEYLLDIGRLDDRTALEGAPWSSRN
jgi:hypothetical protein